MTQRHTDHCQYGSRLILTVSCSLTQRPDGVTRVKYLMAEYFQSQIVRLKQYDTIQLTQFGGRILIEFKSQQYQCYVAPNWWENILNLKF